MDYFVEEKTYGQEMQTRVEPYLTARRQDGELTSFDGAVLHYARFSPDSPRGRVVILHGFAESLEKFRELTYYFLQEGYETFVPDLRGHGLSHRPVADLTLSHVDRFEDYVKDLEAFMDRVVGEPCCLFAHSMGGAVAALYMERHPDRVLRAVLASPMIAPARGKMPLWVAKAVCGFFCLLRRGDRRLFLSGEYTGPEKFEESCATSPARFAYYDALRVATPSIQNNGPSYRWTLEALRVTRSILRRGEPEKIAAPVLLLQAAGDTVVLLPPQNAFVARLPRGTLRRVACKHEVYRAQDPVWRQIWKEMLDFYRA